MTLIRPLLSGDALAADIEAAEPGDGVALWWLGQSGFLVKSAAGRVLFDRSRERKKMANDADRLRKYLGRFNLEWAELKERLRQ